MDRISNLLIALKNGGNAKRKSNSDCSIFKITASIAKTLFDAGYIASYSKKAQNGHDVLRTWYCLRNRTNLELMM
jgi:ribosomal protein S8